MRDRFSGPIYAEKVRMELSERGLLVASFNDGNQLRVQNKRGESFDWYPTTGTVKKVGDHDFFEIASNVHELIQVMLKKPEKLTNNQK